MLAVEIINSPSKGVVAILLHKINDECIKEKLKNGVVNSIGLIQGRLVDIIAAGNIAEKASDVDIAEISGICPQHISMIGIFGDTASVAEALKSIDLWEKKRL